jgi:hypothetical protein
VQPDNVGPSEGAEEPTQRGRNGYKREGGGGADLARPQLVGVVSRPSRSVGGCRRPNGAAADLEEVAGPYWAALSLYSVSSL